MRNLVVTALALCLAATVARAAEDPRVAVVTAADDARVAAMTSADRAALTAAFSDDLHYAHSNGKVDTKQSLVEAIATGKTKYLGLEYKERKVTIPAPGVALITGQAWVKVVGASGEQQFDLSFLAAYREEQGKWRFLAWQSARLPAATPAVPAAGTTAPPPAK